MRLRTKVCTITFRDLRCAALRKSAQCALSLKTGRYVLGRSDGPHARRSRRPTRRRTDARRARTWHLKKSVVHLESLFQFTSSGTWRVRPKSAYSPRAEGHMVALIRLAFGEGSAALCGRRGREAGAWRNSICGGLVRVRSRYSQARQRRYCRIAQRRSSRSGPKKRGAEKQLA